MTIITIRVLVSFQVVPRTFLIPLLLGCSLHPFLLDWELGIRS